MIDGVVHASNLGDRTQTNDPQVHEQIVHFLYGLSGKAPWPSTAPLTDELATPSAVDTLDLNLYSEAPAGSLSISPDPSAALVQGVPQTLSLTSSKTITVAAIIRNGAMEIDETAPFEFAVTMEESGLENVVVFAAHSDETYSVVPLEYNIEAPSSVAALRIEPLDFRTGAVSGSLYLRAWGTVGASEVDLTSSTTFAVAAGTGDVVTAGADGAFTIQGPGKEIIKASFGGQEANSSIWTGFCEAEPVDPPLRVGPAGGQIRATVETTVGCHWPIEPWDSWIDAYPNGVGPGSFALNVEPLAGVGARIGSVRVGTGLLTVVQESSCSYGLSADEGSASVAGGLLSFDIFAASGCVWTLSDDAGWIGTTPTSGDRGRTISYTVAPNGTGVQRSGTITLRDGDGDPVAVHSVTQAGGGPTGGTRLLGAFTNGAWFLDRDGDFAFDPATEISGWGSPGDIPVDGDWNGDGFRDLGVFSNGVWFLDRNGDGAFNPATDIKGWGAPGWTPVTGDWNGDGVTDVGAIDPATMTWFLDLNGDFAFDAATEIRGWGSPGNTPVVGDWDGDGADEIGVFAGGQWFRDVNGDGAFDPATEVRGWGLASWTPVVGDWNGDGVTDIGAIDPATMTWFRDMNGDGGFDAATEIVGWGSAGDVPVVADWEGDGDDDLGVFSGGTWFIDANGDQGFDPATDARGWGAAGWTPVPGAWQ